MFIYVLNHRMLQHDISWVREY